MSELSPVSLLFLLLLIKGGGSVNLCTLCTNDLQEASPPTKSAEKKHRERERVCIQVSLSERVSVGGWRGTWLMRMCELGFNYVGAWVEEGQRGQGSPVDSQKRAWAPPKQKSCACELAAGSRSRRLISMSSRLASNNDGSASVHPVTLTLIPQWERAGCSRERQGGGDVMVVDICRYVTACRSTEQLRLSSISRSADLVYHPSASHCSLSCSPIGKNNIIVRGECVTYQHRNRCRAQPPAVWAWTFTHPTQCLQTDLDALKTFSKIMPQ